MDKLQEIREALDEMGVVNAMLEAELLEMKAQNTAMKESLEHAERVIAHYAANGGNINNHAAAYMSNRPTLSTIEGGKASE